MKKKTILNRHRHTRMINASNALNKPFYTVRIVEFVVNGVLIFDLSRSLLLLLLLLLLLFPILKFNKVIL